MKLKIRHKLFLTIFLTSSLVAGGLFFVLKWSFDRGFLNYVNNQELEQLETLAETLAGYYDDEDGWEKFEDNHLLWRTVQRRTFFKRLVRPDKPDRRFAGMRGPEVEGRPEAEGRPEGGRRHDWQSGETGKNRPLAPAIDPVRVSQRMLLFDADKKWVMGGPPDYAEGATRIPIKKGDETIGYLGLVPVSELSDTGDLMFVKQQKTTFAIVAVMMLGISILLSFPVTSHLLKPIRHLTGGTRKLIGGKFGTRIPVTSGDELGQLSEDFNILAMTLEKNEKARQRWIADISHELRTPLTVLRGEMEALLDGVRRTGTETIEPLHSEILHMQRLVNDLYELSMSDIGALTYKKVPVDIVGILEGTLEMCETRLSENGLELKTDIHKESSCSLLGDPDRLQQLFSNLLTNSLRYTDVPGMLEIKVEKHEENVVLLFQDTAPGVTKEQLPLLFDRLYRTDPSRNRTKSGGGLGLAICTNIVEAHQGEITSYPSPHGGLGIKIQLPLSE